MELQTLLSKFDNNTRIQIENINGVLYHGFLLNTPDKFRTSNLDVTWCEIRDGKLIIFVEY